MKTLIEATHPGRHINGFGGCHTRWAHEGLCSGHETADWLNSLGDDDDVYIRLAGVPVTVGQVRQNWLNNVEHIRVVRAVVA